MNTYSDKIIQKAFGVESLLDSSWFADLKEFNAWYMNDTDFHKKWVWNGDRYVLHRMSRTGIVKLICSSKADLEMNEKVEITVPEKYRVEFDDLLYKNNFWVRMNQAVEQAHAHGYFSIVVDKTDDGEIVINYVPAVGTFPISAVNGEVDQCVFFTTFHQGSEEIIRLEGHFLNEIGNYVIKNAYLKKTSSGELMLLDVGRFEQLPEVDTGSSVKRFAILSPNSVNNLRPDIPLGIPCFANSIYDIRGLDTIYDSYINEFVLGRKRIIYSAEASKPSMTGGEVPNFDPFESAYLRVDFKNPDKPFLEEINMEIRSEAHKLAMNDILNMISIKCGLGLGYFSFEGNSGLKTATEIVSEKSELFRAIKKDEIVIEQVIRTIVDAIFDLKGWIFNEDEFQILFDDSIIEDKTAKRNQMMQEVTSRIRTPQSYYKEVYGYTDEEIAEIIPADYGQSLEERLGLDRF